METKRCSRCTQYLGCDAFHPSQWRKGAWCRACMSVYYKAKNTPKIPVTEGPRPCAECGASYTPKTRNRESFFCSRRCKADARNQRLAAEHLASKVARPPVASAVRR